MNIIRNKNITDIKNKYRDFITVDFTKIKAAMLILLFMQSVGSISAQNIANPDFEILTTAGQYPTTYSQMNRAASWIQPTAGTCDYHYGPPNPSDNRIILSPSNAVISAQSGAAYAAGFMETRQSSANNSKEYITNLLSKKLTAGVTYSISFYTMHIFGNIQNPGYTDYNYVDLPAAEQGFLGLCFSSSAPNNGTTSSSGAQFLGLGGMLNSWNPTKRTLIPADNTAVYGAASRNTWVPVTLLYTADGTEEFMTIGQWRQAGTSLPVGNAAYYLFDNFSPTINPVTSLSKSVSPTSILDGGTATYTFTINNTSAGNGALSGISFTDTLPSGLRIASTPNVVVTGLTGGTTTATAGGTSIAANTTATITVNVTNAAGQFNASCGSNPAAFTNSAANISNLSANLANNVGNVCLVVTSCAAGTTAPTVGSFVN